VLSLYGIACAIMPRFAGADREHLIAESLNGFPVYSIYSARIDCSEKEQSIDCSSTDVWE
jgi:hypothetical protein